MTNESLRSGEWKKRQLIPAAAVLMPYILFLCFSHCGRSDTLPASIGKSPGLNADRCDDDKFKKEKTMDHLDTLIENFKKGEEYDIYQYEKNKPLITRSVRDNRPDCFTLNYLENRIQKENDFVSMQIVNFLEDLAVHADPFNSSINRNLKISMGFVSRIINDESIVSIFVNQLLKDGGSYDFKERVYKILYRQVPAEQLSPYSDRILQRLERQHSESLIYLVAKAKPRDALDRIRSLFSKRRQMDKEPAKIAIAALGDGKIEQELIRDFLEEKSPKEKISKGNKMADIGTHASIYALASELRTPLVFVVDSAFARSIRLELISSLQFALPTAAELYYPIRVDDDYIKVEKYVEKTLGVKWQVDRPPFMTELALAPGFGYRDNRIIDLATGQ